MVNMRSLRSKEDDVQKISSSVFVTNFPEQFSAKDVWNTCKVYGHVVDTYIPDRRSKISKRFRFVCFINVFDMERLVNNLCTVWIGKLKLHANVARYQRDSRKNNYQRLNKGTNVSNGGSIKNGGGLGSSANSYANVVKKPTGVKETIDGTPTMVLDESCLNNEEFSLCLLGKVTKFASLINLKVVLAKEGFGNIELKYMGGFWVMIVFQEEETMKAFHENKSVPDFEDDCDDDDFESNDGTQVTEGPRESVGKCSDLEGKSDSEAIPETRFEDEPMDKFDDINSIPHSKPQSEDPFRVYELLNKKKKVTNNEGESQNSPTYPPGFTPNDNAEDNINTSNVEPVERGHNGDKEEGEFVVSQNQDRNDTDVDANESTCSGHFKKSTRPQTGGSIIQLIEDLVNVGQMMDYGPIPFKFYHYWFKIDGFDKLVEDSWNKIHVVDNNAYVRFMKKLKLLKERIKAWNSSYRELTNYRKNTLKTELTNLDSVLDRGEGIDSDVTRRSDVVRILQDIEKTEAMKVAQKAKIKWAWRETRTLIKNEFYAHFKQRFKKPNLSGIQFDREFPNKICSEQAVDWSGRFQKRRIRSGGNSSFIILIPKVSNANRVKDFRPISLIGSVYKIVAKILANRLVLVLGDLVSDTQSAFLKERQILDGPFILNKVIQWCKKKKKQSMIFKVDFEKAYDSVRWDFVNTILKKFRFGDKWCKWIHSCLQSSRVMESLHLSFQRVVDAGLFLGIKLDSSMSVSHLFYADDAIFMGQWNQSNIDKIVRVLKVFHSALVLRINMKKSKLIGIAVDASRVEQDIWQIGCMALKMPFKYLGSVVRDRMSRVKSWNDVIDTLGIRARFFNGADNKVQKSSWVSWNQVMASMDAGGLGVASLFALNRGLMFKWVWRFITQKNSLWAKVITAIDGDDGKIGKTVNPTFPSIWLNIIQEVAVMKMKGIDVVATKLSHVDLEWSFRRKLRGGAKQIQMTILKEILEGCILCDTKDRWTWSLEGSREFSVSSIWKTIYAAFLPCGNVKTRWVKEVPIKINILAWKVSNDYLPTRFNLSRRGLFYGSNLELELNFLGLSGLKTLI
nr:RNA-directed DNA polymerase, eukaryota [Tanacetum cinerariifolium]